MESERKRESSCKRHSITDSEYYSGANIIARLNQTYGDRILRLEDENRKLKTENTELRKSNALLVWWNKILRSRI